MARMHLTAARAQQALVRVAVRIVRARACAGPLRNSVGRADFGLDLRLGWDVLRLGLN